MVIFPGQEKAASRFFQTYLQLLTDQSFSLSSVRELIAAMADLKSYSHLSKLLNKDKRALQLHVTERFKALLFEKHKFQIDSASMSDFSVMLYRDMPLSILPDPGAEFPDVGGFYHSGAPDLKSALDNSRQLAGLLDRLNRCAGCDEPVEPSIDVPLMLFDEGLDLDELIRDQLFDEFADHTTDEDLEQWGDDPEEEEKAFQAWLKASGRSIASIKLEVECFHQHFFRRSYSEGRPLVTSAKTIDLSDGEHNDLNAMIQRSFGCSGIVIVYQVCVVSAEEADTFEPASQVAERYCYAALYGNGQYIPIGSAKALSVAAESFSSLMYVGDLHSAMGNDIGRAVLNYVDELSDEIKDEAGLLDPVVATALLTAKLAGGKEDDDLKAWLMSQFCDSTQPIPLTPFFAGDVCDLMDFEKADAQSLPFVFKTTAALMLIEGPKPKDNMAYPHLAFAPNGAFSVEREEMSSEDKTRMRKEEAFAEVVRQRIDDYAPLITYDPWDYPTT